MKVNSFLVMAAKAKHMITTLENHYKEKHKLGKCIKANPNDLVQIFGPKIFFIFYFDDFIAYFVFNLILRYFNKTVDYVKF